MSKIYPTDNDYTDGVIYDYTTKLSVGSHTFRFKYKDAYSEILVYPSSGSFTGPSVSSAPDPCEGKVPELTYNPEGKNPSVKNNWEAYDQPCSGYYCWIIPRLKEAKRMYEGSLGINRIDVNITAEVDISSCANKVESILQKRDFAENPIGVESFKLDEKSYDVFYDRMIYENRYKYPEESLAQLMGNFGRLIKAKAAKIKVPVLVIIKVPYLCYGETDITHLSGQIYQEQHKNIYIPSIYEPGHDIWPTKISGTCSDIPQSEPLNILLVEVGSPVDISVVDPLQNKVGSLYKDGLFLNETNDIPQRAFYSGNESKPEIVVIEYPMTGDYIVEIVGVEEGSYDLNLTVVLDNEITLNQTLDDVPIQKGELQEISFRVEGGNAYLLANTYSSNYQTGDTFTSNIYVENTGGVIINEFLVISIKDPTGKIIGPVQSLARFHLQLT